MVSKDQAMGALIFLVCAVVVVGYVVALLFTGNVARVFGWNWDGNTILRARVWLIAIPVFIAVVAVLAIGAWIGWTMATTPPPKPIEELELEEKKEEEKKGD